ncbi:precorrin-6y C5,15-methyltransferase (decarboxylating) subunit CbiE [uncultured Bacteroides sp.]|uniref:precorrin-6y C5,15-methyltransferase (decarboxylating) subunit CbiE n=1 Tax=uncultured Bacteroides sp. TaxID=162156 RepID=UPI002AA6433F|nr:precorrin-6y C5,15-methyltransferase (decarboxylating) subunit CbiE [uncultured Bacteroides sp.]
MEKQKFIVIGLTDSRQQYFRPEVLQLIKGGSVFSGGLRHREIVQELLPASCQWINITAPLDAVFAQYTNHSEVIVFASGDPLFFGFANTIIKRLPEASVKLYPAFNSLQTLAHELLLPYEDMRIISLTGRPWHEFDRALIECAAKMGVLTDREHTPGAIAERMLAYQYTDYVMHVGEHLGNEEKQRIRTLTLEEATTSTFEHPNNLILVNKRSTHLSSVSTDKVATEQMSQQKGRSAYFGIPDEGFQLLNGREKMITKAPIRLLTLSALGLQARTSFWDIGFCTGSVSIEAKLQFPHLKVTAFEIRGEGKQLMRDNAHLLGAPGITTVIGDFLQADLSSLPLPDAVFIGGHGGKLKEMITKVTEVLSPGGIIVFNSVSEQSRTLFLEGVESNQRLRLNKPMRVSIDDYNPITIMSATCTLQRPTI